MDVDVKGAAIGVATAVYASVGFLLSVVAVVLNPLIPASDGTSEINPHHHHHHSLILHRKHPHRTRPDRGRDSDDFSITARANSTTTFSGSSQASSSVPSLRLRQSPSPPLIQEELSGTPTPMPLRRSSNNQRQDSLSTPDDYFSINPAGNSAAVRDLHAETRSSSNRTTSTPPFVSGSSNSSNPSPPDTPQPFISRRPTRSSLTPTQTPTRLTSQLTAPSVTSALPPAPPLVKSHTCNFDEPTAVPPSPHHHSFRISHFKYSWTGKRDKPLRSATCPSPATISHPLPDSINTNYLSPPAISRPPSTSSIKHLCPVGKKTQEKTLRKSLSSPESGLSKWKSHRRKCTNTNSDAKPRIQLTPPIPSPPSLPQLQSDSQLLQPPNSPHSPSPPQSQSKSKPRSKSKCRSQQQQQQQQQPRLRTQPYEAPYFFPTPVSPEAGDYIRRVRSGRPASYSSDTYPVYNNSGKGSNRGSTGEFGQLTLGQGDLKARTNGGVYTVSSAPPTKLKFAV